MLTGILFYFLLGIAIALDIGFKSLKAYILFIIFWCPLMIMGLALVIYELIENFIRKVKGDKNEKS
ncbi:hypothetical protein PP657_gp112 [Bacillus phage BCPST]|uniref:Uncharacterized protein n=1 Tax=Bacillus phage BCPST TaxID=2801506 RepID=A0AAE7P706_9CAUD|nr:hypothetical protein PP657_gp112 [Bacillus phage BCPST]QQO38710.1 hypothetical protein BCPST_092 [Bacillus phage BCPST]